MVRLRPPRERDRLISLVQYGKVTPQQAEAEASARGWPPFETSPPTGQFDPTEATHWSVVMATAWIAWRDLNLTREQSAEFRAQCTHWIFRKWKQPIKKGVAFALRAGWFLESRSAPTTARLGFEEIWMRTHNEMPPTPQMSIREAEAALWKALASGTLAAEGLDSTGKPVVVPARDWPFLKLFEERERDVLKYNALDPSPAYTSVHFRRSDLVRLWPEPTGKIKAERECCAWLVSEMKESPTRRPKPRSEYLADAQRKFPKLQLRQFSRAWDAAIEKSGAVSWSRAGRPSTKSNHDTK